MGMFIQYVIFLYMLMFGANSIQGYSSRNNYRKLEIVESRLNTVIKELEFVKEDLKEEKEKSSYLEIRLDTLIDGGKGTSVDIKDPKKEVDTVQNHHEKRVYNAFYDEKQERKVFEKHVKNFLKVEKANMEMKITSLNETLTAHIETKLKSLEDDLNHSCHDKGWNEWSSWSTCSKSCGIGLQTSTRTCGSTNTLLSGKCCVGTDTKTQLCMITSCPDFPPTANAGDDQTVKMPDDRIVLCGRRSTDDVGIVKYEWSQTGGPKADLRELDSPGIELYNLERGTYTIQIKVTDALGQTDTDDVVITVLPEPDEPPTANAGTDQTVQLPTDTAKLFGDMSTDDQGIVEYRWSVSSTTGREPRMQDSNKAVLGLSNLEEGDYVLTLTVKDKLGQSSSDSARVRVTPAANRPPVADAGRDYTLTLPDNRVTLDGTRSTDDKRVVDYSWEITSGSTRGVRLSESGSNLDVTGLKKGEYEFTLTVRDQNGLTDTDTARVIVKQDAKDCLEVLNQNKNNVNGVYKVRSPSSGLVYPVYCDMTTDGGGWTVFQKRFDGRLDFFRTFKEYEDGFGDVNAEFWMGLNRIHEMTALHETELRIHLTAGDGSTAYQTFQDFSVSPGPDYKLRVGKTAGTAGDRRGLTYTNGMRFSTKDKDVDGGGRDCAEEYHGGWWYGHCGWVNLNGDYATPGTHLSYDSGWGGVIYYSFKQSLQSLKTTSMMFRRK